jgi:hypothetical protein
MNPPNSSGVLGFMQMHSGLKILLPHSGMLRAWHDSAAAAAARHELVECLPCVYFVEGNLHDCLCKSAARMVQTSSSSCCLHH